MRRHDLEADNAINRMIHFSILTVQWVRVSFLVARFPSPPLTLADAIRPKLDQSLLPFWQRTSDQFNRIDAENADLFLIVSVKVRDMVLCTNFHEHPDDDAEEAAQFGHNGILHSETPDDQSRAVRPTVLAISRAEASVFCEPRERDAALPRGASAASPR